MDLDVPTPPGFTGTISELGTESAFEEAQESHAPYSGDTTDAGAEAQAQARQALQDEMDLFEEEAITTSFTQATDTIDENGFLTENALSQVSQPIGQNAFAQGRWSPATSWGSLSEVAQQNKEQGLPTGVTVGMINALNAQDHQGYAINNPQPSEASILASQVFAQLNPTITNAVIGLAGFLPGTVGFTAFLAGIIEDKGLLNIPAVKNIPGVKALSDALAGVRTGIGDVVGKITDPITEPIGQALSEGQQAVADALSGILGPEESAGFEDAGEVEGGALDIEIVPPIATDTDAAPAPTARTYAEVDAKKKERILANILAGLTRTERPTEGVTAFGPLFVDER
jgi:hypothetical protein